MPRRFGIDPDVVFGRRRDVAFATRRAAHDDAAINFGGKRRIAGERQRHIGQRPEGHQRQAGVFAREAQNRLDRVFALRLAARGRIAAIGKAILAVKPMRVLVQAQQRRGGAGKDGNLDAGDLSGEQRVARRLLEPDIARNDGEPEHADVGRGERHQNGDRVVGSSVGVDEELAHDRAGAWREGGAPLTSTSWRWMASLRSP